jgi:hypothetical protein
VLLGSVALVVLIACDSRAARSQVLFASEFPCHIAKDFNHSIEVKLPNSPDDPDPAKARSRPFQFPQPNSRSAAASADRIPATIAGLFKYRQR